MPCTVLKVILFLLMQKQKPEQRKKRKTKTMDYLIVYSALEQFTDSTIWYDSSSVVLEDVNRNLEQEILELINQMPEPEPENDNSDSDSDSGAKLRNSDVWKQLYVLLLWAWDDYQLELVNEIYPLYGTDSIEELLGLDAEYTAFFNSIGKEKTMYNFFIERDEFIKDVICDAAIAARADSPLLSDMISENIHLLNMTYDDLWDCMLIARVETKGTMFESFFEKLCLEFGSKMEEFVRNFETENGILYESEFTQAYLNACDIIYEGENEDLPFEIVFNLCVNKLYENILFTFLLWDADSLEDLVVKMHLVDLYVNYPNWLAGLIWKVDYYTQMAEMEEAAEEAAKAESDYSLLMNAMLLLWCDSLELFKKRYVSIIFFSMGRLYFFTVLSACMFILLYTVFCYRMYIVFPNIYQVFFESVYNFVYSIVSDQAGILAVVHFPLVFTIFNVILYGNIIGLIPYGFTVTSHLTFTFSLGLFVFIGIILLTILNKRVDFFKLFIPTGVPKMLVPLLCVIEVISYIFRVVSLSVRLFANMMAGHALLHILQGFVPIIFNFKNIARLSFVFPIIIIVLITFLEIGISLLQSYVFVVLISIYLRDSYGTTAH